MKWSTVIFIGILFIILLFVQRKFFPEIKTIISSDTVVVTKSDTIYKEKLVPYKVIVENVDTIILPQDSAKLVAKYIELHKKFFSQNFFRDSLNVDSIGTFITKFKVTQNQVFDYKQTYNLQSKKIITQTLANPKNSLYIGAQFGVQSLTPIVIWDNKQKMNYFVSYNLTRKEVNVGVAININKIKLW